MYLPSSDNENNKKSKSAGPPLGDGMGWDGMGWTEVTRKKERRTDSARVVTQENTPLTPLETTERTNDRPNTVRSDGRRSGVRTGEPTDRFRGADTRRRARTTDGKARKREDISLTKPRRDTAGSDR